MTAGGTAHAMACRALILSTVISASADFLFVVWFVSGIAMIYPRRKQPGRASRALAELDLAAVRLAPAEALTPPGRQSGRGHAALRARPSGHRFGGRGG